MKNRDMATGGSRLLLDAVLGTSTIAEKLHTTIVKNLVPAPEGEAKDNITGVLTGPAYAGIGRVVDVMRDLVTVAEGRPSGPGHQVHADSRLVSAVNGICGDHLEQTANTLAISMHMRTDDGMVMADNFDNVVNASPHILVSVHGLCMSHLDWNSDGPGIGAMLQKEAGYTALTVTYNSGRHISSNGQDLDILLENMVSAWPVPVKSIALIGHSMGGLLIRSACHYGTARGAEWGQYLSKALYLGSPHHGAPAAKAGHLASALMSLSDYAEPFAFGQYVSDGVKDLRFGNLLDEDWQGIDQDGFCGDGRAPVPLLVGTDHYFIAAALGDHALDSKSTILGDLLVRLGSATGHHADKQKKLPVDPENCRIFERQNHFDLLTDGEVQGQILEWMRP